MAMAIQLGHALWHRPRFLVIALRPNPSLPRRQDAPRIQCILDCLVELHLRVVVPAVGIGNLVRQHEVGAVLALALPAGVSNKRLDELMCAALGVRIGRVEDKADHGVDFVHANNKDANEFESEFAAAALGDSILGHGGEEDVGLYLPILRSA